jgi:hypothetical protein
VSGPVARVHGIDFSGATDAGRRIWVASGAAVGGVLRITDLRRAAELPGGGVEHDAALGALRGFMVAAGTCAIGCDFPFGLPGPLVAVPDWVAFALDFVERYPTPECFRAACRAAAGSKELRRETDRETRTPFSPYNLRLYRQTWTGIVNLLAPLVLAGAVAVPMQPLRPNAPWLLEVCPASTLKRAGLSRPYKGRTTAHRAARAAILAALAAGMDLEVPAGIRRRAIADPGGDALDALIAALATARAVRAPDFPGADPRYALEGRVYA